MLGTSVWAPAEPADVEAGNAGELMESDPAAREALADFSG